MWRVLFSLSIVLIWSLSGCTVNSNPDTPVGQQAGEPQTPVPRSIWDTLTNRSGRIEGRLTLPDGSPAASFTFDCKPLFNIPSGRSAIGMASGANGYFECGGPPGKYQIEVYSKEGKGVIASKQVELRARETITVDLVVQP